MIAAGIIDPTKVVRSALQVLVAVAGLLITTEAMVAEASVKNGQQALSADDMGAWPQQGGICATRRPPWLCVLNTHSVIRPTMHSFLLWSAKNKSVDRSRFSAP